MNDHVLDRIADYIAGRLPQEQHLAVEAHLQECGDCAGEFAWAGRFKEAALRDGVRHLDPARIVELAGKMETASEPEAAHLSTCTDCRRELQWAGHLQEPVMDSDSGPGYQTWIGLAAVMMVALALFLFLPQGPDGDVTGLARLEPLPVRITRDVPEPDSYEESRLLGLEAYAGGDYATASDHFGQAMSRLPDEVENLIYLGSSWLLQDQPEKAAEVLRRARDLAAGTSLEPEALWQFANSELANGRGEPAEKALHRLQTMSGPRAGDAGTLLVEMEAGRR